MCSFSYQSDQMCLLVELDRMDRRINIRSYTHTCKLVGSQLFTRIREHPEICTMSRHRCEKDGVERGVQARPRLGFLSGKLTSEPLWTSRRSLYVHPFALSAFAEVFFALTPVCSQKRFLAARTSFLSVSGFLRSEFFSTSKSPLLVRKSSGSPTQDRLE
jgi:hypothetical protein